MTKRTCIVFLVACTLATAQVLPENSAERRRLLRETARKLLLDIDSVKKKVFINLPAKEAQIVAEIVFDAPNAEEDDIDNCYALRDAQGRKVVIIGPTFARSLRMFIDAQLIGQILNRPSLSSDYVDYVLSGWKENLQRKDRGAVLSAIESPYTYMKASPEILNAIEEPSSRAYGASLAFVLAHEAGHHVLGHDVSDKKQSIQREREADTWAMGTLLSGGEPPTSGLVAIGYFAALYEAEGASATHPAPKDRGIAMIKSTLQNLDRFSERARQNGLSMTNLRNRLTETLSQLER